MNEKSVIKKFLYDSREYITKSSIDNILTEIGQNDLNSPNCRSDYVYLMYLSKEYNTYLAMKIKTYGQIHTYLLKFDKLSTLEYLLQKHDPLKYSMKNIPITQSLVDYNESAFQYNGYKYSIIIIDYHMDNIGLFFYIIDSESREEIFSITYKTKIKVMINSFTLLRFPNISRLAIQKEILLNNLPKIFVDQITATTVKLSLL